MLAPFEARMRFLLQRAPMAARRPPHHLMLPPWAVATAASPRQTLLARLPPGTRARSLAGTAASPSPALEAMPVSPSQPDQMAVSPSPDLETMAASPSQPNRGRGARAPVTVEDSAEAPTVAEQVAATAEQAAVTADRLETSERERGSVFATSST